MVSVMRYTSLSARERNGVSTAAAFPARPSGRPGVADSFPPAGCQRAVAGPGTGGRARLRLRPAIDRDRAARRAGLRAVRTLDRRPVQVRLAVGRGLGHRVHGGAGARSGRAAVPAPAAGASRVRGGQDRAAGRVQVPCRTAALVLVWSLPIGIAMFRLWHTQRLFGPAAAWLIALVVFGWRLAKALQDSREQARTSSVAGALAAPYAMATAGSGGPAAAPPGAAAAAAAARSCPPGQQQAWPRGQQQAWPRDQRQAARPAATAGERRRPRIRSAPPRPPVACGAWTATEASKAAPPRRSPTGR